MNYAQKAGQDWFEKAVQASCSSLQFIHTKLKKRFEHRTNDHRAVGTSSLTVNLLTVPSQLGKDIG